MPIKSGCLFLIFHFNSLIRRVYRLRTEIGALCRQAALRHAVHTLSQTTLYPHADAQRAGERAKAGRNEAEEQRCQRSDEDRAASRPTTKTRPRHRTRRGARARGSQNTKGHRFKMKGKIHIIYTFDGCGIFKAAAPAKDVHCPRRDSWRKAFPTRIVRDRKKTSAPWSD